MQDNSQVRGVGVISIKGGKGGGGTLKVLDIKSGECRITLRWGCGVISIKEERG